ncbi:MAG: helix-turn-helix domain-containing protein [Lentisphaeria bacterium]|nr:helix-turn-helix domain-containing protein [Lentisphaeria bacterium]
MSVKAEGIHYFQNPDFPVALCHISDQPGSQHEHDLTEVNHFHNFAELVVVLKGRGVQWIEGIEFEVSAGDVFLLQGDQSHFFSHREGLELYNIMIDIDELAMPMEQLKKIPGYHALFTLEPEYREKKKFGSCLHLKSSNLGRCETLISAMVREIKAEVPGFQAALIGLLTELLVFLSRKYSETVSIKGQALLRLGEVIGALESDLKRQWKLEDLASRACMSSSNLLVVFKEATGTSPIDYLIGIRLRTAAELLRSTNQSITEIAFATGFKDSNYFTRQFNKRYSVSPSKYRKRINT